MRGRIFLFAWAGFVAAGIAAPAAAQYGELPPTIFALDSEGKLQTKFAPGDTIVVTGFGFPEDVKLKITFEQNPVTVIATPTTFEDGSFFTQAGIPADARTGAATLAAEPESGSGPRATLGLSIVAAQAAASPTPAPTATPARAALPDTGSDIGKLALWGIGLSVGGGSLARYARRRRAAAPDVYFEDDSPKFVSSES